MPNFAVFSWLVVVLLPLRGISAQAPPGQDTLPLRRTVIVIDPGHPSEVGLGTRGKRVTEVRIVWAVAQHLRRLLERDGFSVVLTKRTMAQRVTNRRRAEIANDAHASLMVRLHCDAARG